MSRSSNTKFWRRRTLSHRRYGYPAYTTPAFVACTGVILGPHSRHGVYTFSDIFLAAVGFGVYIPASQPALDRPLRLSCFDAHRPTYRLFFHAHTFSPHPVRTAPTKHGLEASVSASPHHSAPMHIFVQFGLIQTGFSDLLGSRVMTTTYIFPCFLCSRADMFIFPTSVICLLLLCWTGLCYGL